jgi:hypothetical protein
MNSRSGFKVIIYSVIGLVLLLSAVNPVAAQSNQQGFAKGGKLSYRLARLTNSLALQSEGIESQAQDLSLSAQGAGSLIRNTEGALLVDIHMKDLSNATLNTLGALGVQIVYVANQYNTVTAYVPVAQLPKLADLDPVTSILEELAPVVGDGKSPPKTIGPNKIGPQPEGAGYACPQGIAVSAGDDQLKADTTRLWTGIDGTNATVGILSDSFDEWAAAPTHYIDDIASGDLPGSANPCGYTSPVFVLSDFPGQNVEDEGRAMAQIVHDLAPGAGLEFATAQYGLFSFANNIRTLRQTGSNIIVDDVTYFAEPMFQEGPVNVAISDVVKSGALYFTAAGNDNLIINGKNVGSYESPAYRKMACPTFLTQAPYYEKDCHNFNSSGTPNYGSGFTLDAGKSVGINFQWAEPWYGVITDLDLYVLDDSNDVVASSTNDSIQVGWPWEYVAISNNSSSPVHYRIVVARYAGTSAPRLKYIYFGASGLAGNHVINVQYDHSQGKDIVGPTLMGHSATTSGFSVAAVPYNNSNAPENYSSRGPATLYFGPVANDAVAPSIKPIVLNQPDMAATDGGCTTFFITQSGGCYRFYGTSAAAPHAAAVAALIESEDINYANLTLVLPQARNIFAKSGQLVSGADKLSVGSGLVDALAAMTWMPIYTPTHFNKLTPAKGAVKVVTSNLKISWSPSKGVGSNPNDSDGYFFCITSTAPTIRQVTCSPGWINVGQVISVTASGLSSATTFYWKVAATDGYGNYTFADNGDWSSFTTN